MHFIQWTMCMRWQENEISNEVSDWARFTLDINCNWAKLRSLCNSVCDCQLCIRVYLTICSIEAFPTIVTTNSIPMDKIDAKKFIIHMNKHSICVCKKNEENHLSVATIKFAVHIIWIITFSASFNLKFFSSMLDRLPLKRVENFTMVF